MNAKPEGKSLAEPQFETVFQAAHGQPVAVARDVVRVTADNGGPFTFKGTNSYLVGTDTVAVIDPGPPDANAHLDALVAAIAGRPVAAVLVTHTHVDHSPLARPLAALTGAPIIGCAPHRAARDLHLGEINRLDASADRDHAPDRILGDGESVTVGDHRLTAIATPGHTANHLAFALEGTGIVFSGDHVMAWSTSIVAPPDGDMAAYMASLDTLIARDDRLYLPGHGGAVSEPQKFVRAIRSHRRLRERSIVERIEKGDTTIAAIVAVLYRATDKRLHGAAALSVFAHLEDLCRRGLVTCDGPPSLDAHYSLASETEA